MTSEPVRPASVAEAPHPAKHYASRNRKRFTVVESYLSGRCAFARCGEKSVSRGVCRRHFELLFHRPPSARDNPILAYRAARDLSQEDLAQLCGVSYKTIIRWEKGRPPRYADLILLGLERLEELATLKRVRVPGP